ncbi:MAG: DUF5020 family protein [Bacteroidales bacterium]|nr:DUF5020 family protein [Bacteroidales bacterium]MCR5244826.1 DUF5020 family protein [Bacteroidales bacterium]
MRKFIIAAAFAALAFAQGAKAQTNVQTFYDFGKDRNYVTTTFEMFKGDKFGDTFFFIDHYYATSDQVKAGVSSAINGSYFEIERGINFWQDSDLKDLSGHIEYDGSTWGAGIWCFGAKYFFHSADFSKTFTAAIMYDLHRGVGSADIPVKFSGVWGLNDLLGVKGLVFKGFIDVWGNNSVFADLSTAKFSVLTEPQLWMNLGSAFDGHLDLGCEIELSYNFAGNKGFMCNPCAGFRWTF